MPPPSVGGFGLTGFTGGVNCAGTVWSTAAELRWKAAITSAARRCEASLAARVWTGLVPTASKPWKALTGRRSAAAWSVSIPTRSAAESIIVSRSRRSAGRGATVAVTAAGEVGSSGGGGIADRAASTLLVSVVMAAATLCA